MKILKPTNNELNVILIILLCIMSIAYLLLPRKTDLGLCFSYSILIGSFTFLSGWIIGINKGGNGVLDFLKILLPASGTLIAAIWLLSSGYLNLKAENLKKEIYGLKQQDSALQNSVRRNKLDSISIVKSNDSITSINLNLRADFETYKSMTANEISKMSIEKRKAINANEKLKKNYIEKIVADSKNQRKKLISIDLEKVPIEFLITFITTDGDLLSDKDLNIVCRIQPYNETRGTSRVNSTVSFNPLTGKFKILTKIDNQRLNNLTLKDVVLISPEKIIYPDIYPNYFTIFNQAIPVNIISSELIIKLPNHYKKEYSQ